jgi:hypothetical protein
MPLLNCPDCAKACSTEAATCPNCGRPLGRQEVQEGFLHKLRRVNFFAVLGVSLASFAVFFAITNSGRQTSNKSLTTNVSNTGQTVNNTPQPPTSAEILSDVKRTISYPKLIDRDYYEIDRLLKLIPADAAEYEEAQEILKRYAKQIDAARRTVFNPPKPPRNDPVTERTSIQNELAQLEHEEGQQEIILNQTENMEGTVGKQLYLNALKRKEEIQLRKIELERKLKKLP